MATAAVCQLVEVLGAHHLALDAVALIAIVAALVLCVAAGMNS
jgi:hypothetical protein